MNWKKTFRWAGAIISGLMVVVLAGGYFFLKTPQFHRYVLARIVEQAQTATGGRLELRNWGFHLSPLTVDLDGIVLHGTEASGAPPLLQADRITIGVNARALLHRKIQLSEILIQHPVANLSLAADGKTNLPTAPTQSSSNITIWNLAVGHALLTNGEIYYNDKKIALNADLYDLRTEIYFNSSPTRYNGSISYRNGRLQYANYSPLPHNFDAQFSMTPDGLTINSSLLTVGASQISIRGVMNDYNHPEVTASYQLLLHAQDFASLSPEYSAGGDLQSNGDLHYKDDPTQPLLRNVTIEGSLASALLQAASADGRLDLKDLKAQYALRNGNLTARDIAADVLSGQLSGDLSLQHLDTTQAGTFHATLREASLESARKSINRGEIKRAPVTGTVDAKLSGSWKGSVSNLHLLGDVGLRAAVWNDTPIAKSPVPVDGNGHLAYDGAHNIVTLRQTTLRIPSTSVVLDGEIGNHFNLRVHAVAGDLHQLAVLASSLRTASSEPDSEPIAVSGIAKLDASIKGSMRRPLITAQLDAHNLEVEGSQWKSAQIALEANPSQVNIQHASLVSARQGELSFSGKVSLSQWSYLPSSAVEANLSAKGMSVADLEHLATLQYPVSGHLSANIFFQGSQLHPAGHGSIQIAKASVYDQPVQNLNIQFQTANESISSTLNVSLPAGSASADLIYNPATKAYKVQLHTPGIALQKLQALEAKNAPITGTLTASASGEGTIDNPQLDISLQIPTLQVRETAITNMQAQLQVRDRRANLSLGSDIAQAFIRANATVDLTGDYNAQATIETNKVPLDPFLAIYVPSVPSGFHGETELHASLKGPLKDKSRLEAHITIPTLTANYQSLQLGNSGPIRVDYANSVVTIAPAELRGTQTSLSLQGRVPLAAGAAMNLQAKGSVNLGLLAMFNSDLQSSGSVDFEVRGAGPIQQPSVEGKIQISKAALSMSDLPVGLSQLNGALNVTNHAIEIAALKGEVGGGEISASGSVSYSPALQFNVALQGKSIRLLYPDGVRTLLTSNLTFSGDMQAASLKGRAVVDSLNFTPEFDLAGFATQFNGISVPSSGQSFADRITLAVAVQSSQTLAARSSQVSLEGIANLQINGTAADPVVVGRIDLTSGELFFLNNRYQLRRGIVMFNDPNQTRPVLNVQATTTIEQYNLTLTLTGPTDNLTTNYVSDPALPTADVISLVYRGQTVEEAAAAGTSTDSLLASQAASQFSSGLQKLAGISSLQIDPTIGGSNTDPSARVALQQRVTKNFLFTFSTDVTQPEQEIVQGEYQFNKRWSVSVTRDQLGGISVDGRYHTHF